MLDLHRDQPPGMFLVGFIQAGKRLVFVTDTGIHLRHLDVTESTLLLCSPAAHTELTHEPRSAGTEPGADRRDSPPLHARADLERNRNLRDSRKSVRCSFGSPSAYPWYTKIIFLTCRSGAV